MTKIVADISMSLDGYVTGAGADPAHGLGDAPEIHAWVAEQDPIDTEILEGATAASGAVVMGKAVRHRRRSPRLVEGHGLRRGTSRDTSLLRRHPRPAVRGPTGTGSRYAIHVRARSRHGDRSGSRRCNGRRCRDHGGRRHDRPGTPEGHRGRVPCPSLADRGRWRTPLFRAGTRQRFRQREVRQSSNAIHITHERVTDESERRAEGQHSEGTEL